LDLPTELNQLESKPKKTVRVGFLGLMSKSWVETSCLNLKDFKLEKTFTVGKNMASLLKSKYQCDLVVAVTHMSNNEDMNLQNLDSEIDISKDHFGKIS
jgi:2',3'-cyclic-nucleotide 2'-phosphodiesterase (5'-nucleotidase family)